MAGGCPALQLEHILKELFEQGSLTRLYCCVQTVGNASPNLSKLNFPNVFFQQISFLAYMRGHLAEGAVNGSQSLVPAGQQLAKGTVSQCPCQGGVMASEKGGLARARPMSGSVCRTVKPGASIFSGHVQPL